MKRVFSVREIIQILLGKVGPWPGKTEQVTGSLSTQQLNER